MQDPQEGGGEGRSHPAVPRLRLRPLSQRSPLWYRPHEGSAHATVVPPGAPSDSPDSSWHTPGAPRDPIPSQHQQAQPGTAEPLANGDSLNRSPCCEISHGDLGSQMGDRSKVLMAKPGGGRGQGRCQKSRWESADRVAEGSKDPPMEQGRAAWQRGFQGPQPGPLLKGPLPPALDGLLQLHMSHPDPR